MGQRSLTHTKKMDDNSIKRERDVLSEDLKEAYSLCHQTQQNVMEHILPAKLTEKELMLSCWT